MRHYVLTALILASTAAAANVAEQSHRSQVAGIDLITYRTDVKQVVVILGSLPAGDALAESGNIAIPTLTGMMLDRGTKTLDKFAIAEQLDNVGAEIAFTVGTQSLEVRAKCLKKDLPLIVGLIAAELRTPAFQAPEFNKAKQQFIGALEASAQNTEARAQEAFARAIFPQGHPNRPHSVSEYEAAAKAATLDELEGFLREILRSGAYDPWWWPATYRRPTRRPKSARPSRVGAAARITSGRQHPPPRRRRARYRCRWRTSPACR